MEAQEAVQQAEQALDAWVDDPTVADDIGAERFQRGMRVRQQRLEKAQAHLWEQTDPEYPEGVSIVGVGGRPYPYTDGTSQEVNRYFLQRAIESVTLAKADTKRRRWQPIDERVQVSWVS